LYKFDTYNLIAAGLRGGKNTSADVAARPRLFVTLTAPSFGPVHLGPDRHGTPRPCHTRMRGGVVCGGWHQTGDSLVGTPVDPAGYDYVGQVLFNAHAGRLWARFTIETRRGLAASAHLSRRAASAAVRVVFAKVAEFQTRGVVHFHAVIRLDGPTELVSPPGWATVALLARVVRNAVRRAEVSTPDSAVVPARRLRWGGQLDIRPIAVGGEVSDALVARYVAKYASKSAEAAGITLGPIWCRACTGLGATAVTTDAGQQAMVFCRTCRGTGRRKDVDLSGLSGHVAALVGTCWRLGGRPEFAHLNLRRWAHMLAYPGHFTTKSRTYSTTYADLRAERQEWTATHREPRVTSPSDVDLVVVDDWHYHGRGFGGDAPAGGEGRG
jgi:hypothetical protein